MKEFHYLLACWGFWVAIFFPLWMTSELEVPDQQYANPVLPIYAVSAMFAGPTYLIQKIIWRRYDN
jgi:hypothetical protein